MSFRAMSFVMRMGPDFADHESLTPASKAQKLNSVVENNGSVIASRVTARWHTCQNWDTKKPHLTIEFSVQEQVICSGIRQPSANGQPEMP
jgi:hypothetical protein